MAEADVQIGENEAAEAAPAPVRRRWGRIAAMASLPLALLVGGFLYWESLQGKVSTDNAYVKQDMVAVGAEVGGRIVEVRVREDQRVAAGLSIHGRSHLRYTLTDYGRSGSREPAISWCEAARTIR